MAEKFIVAIGSSAGGLGAMKSFFNCTPNDHVTYIILRHVSFDFQSKLHEVMQPYSKLKIVEAENGKLIEQNTVYMQPAAMYLTFKNDRLYLEPRINFSLSPNWSSDIFLTSLSKTKGRKSIAIILSGDGTDGTKGACAIKEAGGVVIVQDPASCGYSGMPNNVIKAGCVHHILLPEEMPSVIAGHVNESLASL